MCTSAMSFGFDGTESFQFLKRGPARGIAALLCPT